MGEENIWTSAAEPAMLRVSAVCEYLLGEYVRNIPFGIL